MKSSRVIVLLLLLVTNSYAVDILNIHGLHTVSFDPHESPSDIYFTKDFFYIYESVKGEILKFSSKDFNLISRKRLESGEGGIAIAYYKNRWYLSANRQGSINVYDENFDLMGKHKSIAKDPTDMEFYGEYGFIVDNDNHKILKVNINTWEKEGETGVFGFNENQFRFPFDIKIDERGDIFVSEVINTRVQVFNQKLKFVDFVGGWGIKSGEFYRPKGIEFYKNYLLVADGYTGVVQLFDKQKRTFSKVLGEDGKIKRFTAPTRLRVLGNILGIVDYFNKKIYIYELDKL